jgi:hypothetical protein
MPTNDFKVVAASASTSDITTQAAYLTDTILSTGNATGIVPRTKFNKQIRQATSIAAMIGQFIVDKSGQDALDLGTPANQASLLANFKTAVSNQVFPSGTSMAFFQASAPTGWTQDTTNNNAMLRVVSTTGGGIGGVDSPIFNNKVPIHAHSFSSSGDVSGETGHAHIVDSAVTVNAVGNHTHGDTFAIASAGAHSHTYSDTTSAISAHSHVFTGSAVVSSTDSHSHTLTGVTNTVAAHDHNAGTYNRMLRAPYVGSLTGFDSTNSGSEQAVGSGDSGQIVADGSHSHSLSGTTTTDTHNHSVTAEGTLASNGGHSHSFSGTVAAEAAHTHTVTGGVSSAGTHTHTASLFTLTNDSTGHTHSYSVSGNTTYNSGINAENWIPKYIDMIICTKN